MPLIYLLLLLSASALTDASRLVVHTLSGREVRRLLRAADRLDAIPSGHVVGDGLAILDDKSQTSANGHLGRGLNIFGGGGSSSGGYAEVCFGSAPRTRMQLARSPRSTTGTTSGASSTYYTPSPYTPSMSFATPPTPPSWLSPTTPTGGTIAMPTTTATTGTPTSPTPSAPSDGSVNCVSLNKSRK